MRSRCDGERGTVTVEFAVALPVVVVVVSAALGAVLAVDLQGRLQSAGGAASRALGRGDTAAADRALRSVPDAVSSSARSDGLVCVTLTRSVRLGPVDVVPIRATGCAADGGG